MHDLDKDKKLQPHTVTQHINQSMIYTISRCQLNIQIDDQLIYKEDNLISENDNERVEMNISEDEKSIAESSSNWLDSDISTKEFEKESVIESYTFDNEA